ncbi:double-stranded RNA-binding protein Staufen homolog 2-like [Anthonomus grandis grandis]|uniref:double-stranded RNA-binding protein Staufen homolog 2-like n=1 Tax=Anthonomus grandis grandis TaxID=2921223 RepID=UPI002165AF53|nr:double-stranded RNA-binding protein Staufen homolog 2-like [Anthonomus grandis grandis]
MKFVFSLYVLFILRYVSSISLPDILEHFKYKDCIPGSLLTITEETEDLTMKGVPESGKSYIELYNVGHSETEQSAMSSINELAQYNSITYSYELIKEEGPPHSKMFTVTLYLGDEQYSAENSSLKKAQQDAALIALRNTQYEHPPVKIKENEKSPTPTVLLNNLASKLGLKVTYTVVTDVLLENLNRQKQVDVKPIKSYLQKLNDTIHSNDTIHIRKDGSDSKGPFTVRVDVNGEKFFGEAHTIKNARHEAAVKALQSLKENQQNFKCLKEDDNCKSKKQSIKSPISQVHEAAQRRNLVATFEVIDEEGPSHKKTFTTKCTAGSIEAIGTGTSKKKSKQAAAENILPQLMEVPEAPAGSYSHSEHTKKKSKKNKRNKVIKTTLDKIDRMFDEAVDFGKGLIDKIRGSAGDNEDSTNPKKNNKQQKMLHRSATDEIVQLGNILSVDVQYTDFENGGKVYAVLEMGTKPSFMCLGEGINQKNSRDLASRYGIKTLYNLGLLDGLLDKTMTISNVLDKEEEFQKFWLEEQMENSEKE